MFMDADLVTAWTQFGDRMRGKSVSGGSTARPVDPRLSSCSHVLVCDEVRPHVWHPLVSGLVCIIIHAEATSLPSRDFPGGRMRHPVLTSTSFLSPKRQAGNSEDLMRRQTAFLFMQTHRQGRRMLLPVNGEEHSFTGVTMHACCVQEDYCVSIP